MPRRCRSFFTDKLVGNRERASRLYSLNAYFISKARSTALTVYSRAQRSSALTRYL